jgi:hypothetical protein
MFDIGWVKMNDDDEAGKDRIYVDDSLPARLPYYGRAVGCATLHEAIKLGASCRKTSGQMRNDSRLWYLMQKSKDRGLTRDQSRQDHPKSNEDAQKPVVKEQKEAAAQQVESPGEPAGGE